MTPSEAEQQLKRVFTAFPSYRQFLRQLDEPNATLDAWIGMLTACDAVDVTAIVDQIVSGDLEPTTQYQKPDMLPRNIRNGANDMRARRNDRRQQDMKYHQAIDRLLKDNDKFSFAMRESHRLGVMTREKKIAREEKQRRVEILMDWYRGVDVDLDWVLSGADQ
jgi:hypothetical protein